MGRVLTLTLNHECSERLPILFDLVEYRSFDLERLEDRADFVTGD